MQIRIISFNIRISYKLVLYIFLLMFTLNINKIIEFTEKTNSNQEHFILEKYPQSFTSVLTNFDRCPNTRLPSEAQFKFVPTSSQNQVHHTEQKVCRRNKKNIHFLDSHLHILNTDTHVVLFYVSQRTETHIQYMRFAAIQK